MGNRNTQIKGDRALARAIFVFTERGYNVSIPLSESLPYDLIVDDGTLNRVQVKFLGESTPYVDLRRIHSNANGYVINRYQHNSYDWLYVYKENCGDYLHRSFIKKGCYTPKIEDKI